MRVVLVVTAAAILVAVWGCPNVGTYGCVTSDDCPQGYACSGGTCARSCASQPDGCEPGTTCNGEVCVSNGDTSSGNVNASSAISVATSSITSSRGSSATGTASSNRSSSVAAGSSTSLDGSSSASVDSSSMSAAGGTSAVVSSSSGPDSSSNAPLSSSDAPSSSPGPSSSSAGTSLQSSSQDVFSSSTASSSSVASSSSAAASSSSLAVSSSSTVVPSSSSLTSSSSAPVCGPGELLCNGTCTNVTSNNLHCGACNTPCTAAWVGGTAQCGSSTCNQACPAGQAVLNGKCAVWGGTYQTNGVLPGLVCGGTACRRANGYTGGCSCPAGFSPVAAMGILDDSSCSGNPPYGWSTMYTCVASLTPGPDFGGIFHQHVNGTCQTANPFTGACTCPAGYAGTWMRSSHACWQATNVVTCYRAGDRRTFGGSFLDPDHAPYGCPAPNPYTGACSCPSGTVPMYVRSIYGPAQTGSQCERDGQFGALMGFCRVP